MTFVGHCCDYTKFDWNRGHIKVRGRNMYVTGESDLVESGKQVKIRNKNSKSYVMIIL